MSAHMYFGGVLAFTWRHPLPDSAAPQHAFCGAHFGLRVALLHEHVRCPFVAARRGPAPPERGCYTVLPCGGPSNPSYLNRNCSGLSCFRCIFRSCLRSLILRGTCKDRRIIKATWPSVTSPRFPVFRKRCPGQNRWKKNPLYGWLPTTCNLKLDPLKTLQ